MKRVLIRSAQEATQVDPNFAKLWHAFLEMDQEELTFRSIKYMGTEFVMQLLPQEALNAVFDNFDDPCEVSDEEARNIVLAVKNWVETPREALADGLQRQ